MKITPIKYLMGAASNNQATKTKCMEVITQAKSRKNSERKKERTQKEFVYPVRSKTSLI